MQSETYNSLLFGLAYSCAFAFIMRIAPASLLEGERHMEQNWVTTVAPADGESTSRYVSEPSQDQQSCLADNQQTKGMWAINSMLCVTEVLWLLLT